MWQKIIHFADISATIQSDSTATMSTSVNKRLRSARIGSIVLSLMLAYRWIAVIAPASAVEEKNEINQSTITVKIFKCIAVVLYVLIFLTAP